MTDLKDDKLEDVKSSNIDITDIRLYVDFVNTILDEWKDLNVNITNNNNILNENRNSIQTLAQHLGPTVELSLIEQQVDKLNKANTEKIRYFFELTHKLDQEKVKCIEIIYLIQNLYDKIKKNRYIDDSSKVNNK
jgi:hypothetical protein